MIRSDTVPWHMCLNPTDEWKKRIGSAIDDYVSTNKKPWALAPRFTVSSPYQLLNYKKDIFSLFEKGSSGWDDFYAAHPNSGGWFDLSAVGFNEDKTIAVVYMSNHCGWVCGRGDFKVLQKREGKWEDLPWQGGRCLWVS
jgi:hypothetical protein